jgi:catechol 2,3-dioxygenase-like lactoylglutathione lyase family enzyme
VGGLPAAFAGKKPGIASIAPNSLDHVALWVADRDALADLLCGPLGMHVIERTDSFTLVGVDALLGKLTLFEAEGPRAPGSLGRVGLRVRDLDPALADLPDEVEVERDEQGVALFEAPEGLRLGLVEHPDAIDYDLDHVLLRVSDPERAAQELVELGFERRNGALAVADKQVRLASGGGQRVERPLLNHVALLVDSAGEVQEEAERRGLEIADVKDAANTLAVFIRGPDGIEIEYVEHKPGFSLV